MNNPEDANAELGERLTAILRKAHALGLDRAEIITLCYGCGIDRRQVLPRRHQLVGDWNRTQHVSTAAPNPTKGNSQ